MRHEIAAGALALAVLISRPSNALAENSHAAFAKSCGGSTMIVRCSGNDGACSHNELVLRAGAAQPVVVPAPRGLEKYDPVGLSCARAADARAFFVVEYGDASNSCASCEWHHIYSPDGRLLTSSYPAFIADLSQTGGQSSHPNTSDFIKMTNRLGLSKTPMDYGH